MVTLDSVTDILIDMFITEDAAEHLIGSLFELAKKYEKVWTYSGNGYDTAFGLVPQVGVFLRVLESSGKQAFFSTQMTGLTARMFADTMIKYMIPFQSVKEAIAFAQKNAGKGLKGFIPKSRTK